MDLLRRTAMAATVSALCVLGVVSHGTAQASSIVTIHTFGSTTSSPTTGLVYGPGGALYGATGTEIYQLVQDVAGRWQFHVIFGGGATAIAGSPTAIGAISLAGSTYPAAFELVPPATGSSAWKATVLHSFNGGKNGFSPSGIAFASDGSLYGTTAGGGIATDCPLLYPYGCGMVYQLVDVNGRWGEHLIHAFRGGADGSYPVAAPSFDVAGDVFLTTSAGDLETVTDEGCGRLIELRPPLLTVEAYDLCDYLGPRFSYSPDSVVYPVPSGTAPARTLILTTTGGGIKSRICGQDSESSCGIVAEFDRTSSGTKPWDVKVIHEFSGSDGYSPTGYLTAVGATRLYGVANSNVGACQSGWCGEIFALAYGQNGWAWDGVVLRFTTDVAPVPQLTSFNGKLLGTTQGLIYPGKIYEITP